MFDVEKTSDLIQKSKDGDKDALDALIVENTPLVKSVVRRYSGKNVEYDDLMQLGSMGLLKAIKNFDENFNVRFSTYAVPMIAGEIKRFIRDDGAVKVSRALKLLAFNIGKFKDDFSKRTIASRPSTKFQKSLTSIRKKSFSRWTAQDIRCR